MDKVVSPVYQPIVDLRTGRVSHYEALARVAGNTGGHHAPLIEMGEQYGFIHLIDMAMLEHVVKALNTHPDVIIAVNVSVRSIEYDGNEVLSKFFRHMNYGRRLVFEITETVRIEDIDVIKMFIDAVRVAGCRVAVDDFGDGYFTVPIIQHLRPEYLKLSAKLVDVATQAKAVDQLKALVEVAATFGGEIIAEQIDTREKVELLRKAGVRYGQGFHLGAFCDVPNVELVPPLRLIKA